MNKLLLIVILTASLCMVSNLAAAQQLTPMEEHRYAGWHQIWSPSNPPNTTNGGDIWQAGGSWHMGTFRRNGTWSGPDYREIGPVEHTQTYIPVTPEGCVQAAPAQPCAGCNSRSTTQSTNGYGTLYYRIGM